jgi:hypothetical protein
MNNKQHIEGFIQQQRQEFDSDMPVVSHWKSISKSLEQLQNGDSIACFIAINRSLMDTALPNIQVWDKINAALTSPTDTIHTGDPLEHFIQHYRSDFDSEIPDFKIWNQVSHQAASTDTLRISWHRSIARFAAAIALLLIGASLGLWYARHQQETYVGMKMSDVSKEYAAIEQQYEQEIEHKKSKLARFASNPSTSEIFGDMEQMDKTMEELRIELSNVPPGNQEQIIRVMIENYKTKSMVLEQVLEAMQAQQHLIVDPDGQQNTLQYENDTI